LEAWRLVGLELGACRGVSWGKIWLGRRVYRGNNGLDYGANKGPFFTFTPIS
jgi:hypothetical protein